MDIRDIVRTGIVCDRNGAKGTVRVTFPDKEDLVSGELPVIMMGSHGTKEYHLPEEGTQVLCCFMPNPSGRGMNDGFVIGGFYSVEDPPEQTDPKVRCIKLPDGCYIKFDGAGNIAIHATGNLTLTGARIDLN